MKKEIVVTKASGQTEPFSIRKLRLSLTRANATNAAINSIIEQLMPKLYQGISTKKIYSEAFRLLRTHSKPHAARYYLKRGIMELGPSGFPFEKFIAKLFEKQGYSTQVGQIVQGHCVSHELDVIARKPNEINMVECKYRNSAGMPVDVKTPLYINSRFEDVLANGTFKTAGDTVNGWIATNSKFTSDAISYARCKGLRLISWDYPEPNSLRETIDKLGLYPLTCLTSLTCQEKQWLLDKDYVLVRDVYQNTDLLTKAGVNLKRIETVKEEGTKLCNTTKSE
ncbi:MAG: restriction endonuclease [bacterium]|nr:restriction endonuclease [bacterium]